MSCEQSALGGASYAAVKIPKNSVGTKQIKKNAVNNIKVKNGALLAGDFKAGQILSGATGVTLSVLSITVGTAMATDALFGFSAGSSTA